MEMRGRGCVGGFGRLMGLFVCFVGSLDVLWMITGFMDFVGIEAQLYPNRIDAIPYRNPQGCPVQLLFHPTFLPIS